MSTDSTTETLVQDVMTRNVLRVGPLTSVGGAIDLMYEGKVSALPVVDEDDHCLGIITVTDLIVLLRSTQRELNSDYLRQGDDQRAIVWLQNRLEDAPVRDVMSDLMVTVGPEVGLQRAAKTMSDEKVHHLPVISDRRLIGIVSSSDMVAALARKSSDS